MTKIFGAQTRIKIEGQTIGHWEVLAFTGHGYYRVKCVCGIERIKAGADLRSGKSHSCGCRSHDWVKERKSEGNKEAPITNVECLYK